MQSEGDRPNHMSSGIYEGVVCFKMLVISWNFRVVQKRVTNEFVQKRVTGEFVLEKKE